MEKETRKNDISNYDDIKHSIFAFLEKREIIAHSIWLIVFVFGTVFLSYFFIKEIFFSKNDEGNPYVWTMAILFGGIIFLVFLIKIFAKLIVRMKKQTEDDRLIIKNIAGGTMITHFDDGFTIKLATPRFYKMLGYNKGDMKQKYHSEFCRMLVGEESKREFARQKRLLRENGTAGAQYKVLGGKGEVIWLSSRSLLTRNNKYEPTVYTVVFDITNEKSTQQNLEFANERNRIVLEKTESCVFEWDLIKKDFEASDMFIQRFNVERNFVINDEILMKYLHPSNKDELYENIEKLADGTLDNFEIIVELKEADGGYTHNSLNITSLRDNNNVPVRAIGFIINVEEQYRKEEELRKRAAHDSLTGIYNKGATEEMIKNVFEGYPNQSHALLIIDVDDFKSVNDTLGHGAGDEALKLVSSTLAEAFDRRDVVGRIGGDEFMVLAVNIGDNVQRIVEALKNIKYRKMTVVSDGKYMNLTLSIGIAKFSDDADTYEELFKKADISLYESKHNGKDQYTFYKP